MDDHGASGEIDDPVLRNACCGVEPSFLAFIPPERTVRNLDHEPKLTTRRNPGLEIFLTRHFRNTDIRLEFGKIVDSKRTENTKVLPVHSLLQGPE